MNRKLIANKLFHMLGYLIRTVRDGGFDKNNPEQSEILRLYVETSGDSVLSRRVSKLEEELGGDTSFTESYIKTYLKDTGIRRIKASAIKLGIADEKQLEFLTWPNLNANIVDIERLIVIQGQAEIIADTDEGASTRRHGASEDSVYEKDEAIADRVVELVRDEGVMGFFREKCVEYNQMLLSNYEAMRRRDKKIATLVNNTRNQTRSESNKSLFDQVRNYSNGNPPKKGWTWEDDRKDEPDFECWIPPVNTKIPPHPYPNSKILEVTPEQNVRHGCMILARCHDYIFKDRPPIMDEKTSESYDKSNWLGRKDRENLSKALGDVEKALEQLKKDAGQDADKIIIQDQDLTVLHALETDVLKYRVTIATQSKMKEGKAKDSLARLEKLGMTSKPKGPRKGYVLTDKGKKYLDSKE